MLYRVDVTSSDTGALFIAGVPEYIHLVHWHGGITTLVRTAEDSRSARAGFGGAAELRESAQRDRHSRIRYPMQSMRAICGFTLDRRIPELGRTWAGATASRRDKLRHVPGYASKTICVENSHTRWTRRFPARAAIALADFLFATETRLLVSIFRRRWLCCCGRREFRRVWSPVFKVDSITTYRDPG